MKAVYIICLLAILRSADGFAGTNSRMVLTAACEYSLKYKKIPWACFDLHAKFGDFAPARPSVSELEDSCIIAAGKARNFINYDMKRLEDLPPTCAAVARETLSIIKYKKGDI